MPNILLLFFEFFRIGLFSVGGGLATIPFLQQLVSEYTWITNEGLLNIIAVAESTPGPIGINAATYVGFDANGLLGSIMAVLGLVTPSLIIIIVVAHYFNKVKESKIVQDAFFCIRPMVAGLIGAAGMEVAKVSLFTGAEFNQKAWAVLAIMIILINNWERHPVTYIIIGAIVGVLFKM
ncbi:MAG: chromate transporter [Cellulosilyticaceae bacterium]